MAKDIAGHEIAVGMSVAYCMAGQAQNMRIAKVLKISPKTVELDAKAYPSEWAHNLRRSHDSVAIVEVTQ